MATVQKIKIVNYALRKSGIASVTTLNTADPQTVADALEDLEALALQWKDEGLDIGYLAAASGEPAGNQDSGIDAAHYRAVALNLAREILVDNQRDIPDELAAQARSGKLALDAIFYKPSYLQRRNDQPQGQGNNRGGDAYTRFYVQETTEDHGGV